MYFYLFYCDINVLVNNIAKEWENLNFLCVKCNDFTLMEVIFVGGVIASFFVQNVHFRAEGTCLNPLNQWITLTNKIQTNIWYRSLMALLLFGK